MVACDQRNGSGDTRDAGADVGDNISNCERTVFSRVALFVELCGQRIHAAAAEHAREEHHALCAGIAHNAETRNCKQQIGNRHHNAGEPDGHTRSEDAVCHIGADDTADNDQCIVKREELGGLCLRETETRRKCRVQIVNQNRGEAVIRKRIAHELETDREHADRVSHESLVRLNLFNFALFLFCCQYLAVLHFSSSPCVLFSDLMFLAPSCQRVGNLLHAALAERVPETGLL